MYLIYTSFIAPYTLTLIYKIKLYKIRVTMDSQEPDLLLQTKYIKYVQNVFRQLTANSYMEILQANQLLLINFKKLSTPKHNKHF